jgi:hypothetical protein
MKEVQLTSEIMMMMIANNLGSSEQKKINDFYKQYDSELPRQEEIYNNFHLTMKVIDDNFKDFLPSSIFCQQTKIYIFFALIYHLIFGLNYHPKIRNQHQKLSQENVYKIREVCNELQHNKNVIDSSVIKAVESRRQGITDRTKIFKHLVDKII